MRWLWHPNAQASQPAPSAFRTRTATRHMRVLRRACAALLLCCWARASNAPSHAHAKARSLPRATPSVHGMARQPHATIARALR